MSFPSISNPFFKISSKRNRARMTPLLIDCEDRQDQTAAVICVAALMPSRPSNEEAQQG